MAGNTKIEWATKTWNPVRGCSLVSEGCRNCYAMRQAHRFSGKGQPYEDLTEMGPNGPRWNGEIRLVPEALEEPLRWKKPQRVFVNSMSDLFHEDVPSGFLRGAIQQMLLAIKERGHTFIVLTKRPEWMEFYLRAEGEAVFQGYLQKEQGIQWGISVENQDTANKRLPILLRCPVAVRICSYEPALGPLVFNDPTGSGRLDWVIVGGESGPGARPMHPDWARSARDQCQAASVPFFFKQWGEFIPCNQQSLLRIACEEQHNPPYHKVGKRAAGRLLDGREWNEFPRKE